MATKRVLQSSTNWAELAQLVPICQKPNLASFKAKSEGYVRRVMATPEQPPKIDWAFYKANAANKAIVEQFEKAYNALKIPYPVGDDAIQYIEAEQKKWNDDLKTFIQQSNERIKKYQTEIQAYKNTLPMEEMTEEEAAIAYPHVAVDCLNKPTLYPHDDEVQHTKEDLEFFRPRIFHGPDKYHP